MSHSSSSIHKQACYVVTSCPQLESPAIYWSWQDASSVLKRRTSSPPSESTESSAKLPPTASGRQHSSASDFKYEYFNSVFRAVEFMIGSTEYSNMIQLEAERIRKQNESSKKAHQSPNTSTKVDSKFRNSMALLRRYVEENGCLPPISREDSVAVGQPASSLHRFMMQMRQEVRKYHSDPSKSSLTIGQYDDLVSIGFVQELYRLNLLDTPLKASVGRSFSKAASWTENKLKKWNQMLAKVQNFQKEHQRLPCRQDDEKLYRWIQQQKQRVLDSLETEKGNNASSGDQKGSASTNGHASAPTLAEASSIQKRSPELSTEQVVKLATIGVSFVPPRQKFQIETRCQEWISYRQEHGQNPPGKSTLGKWANGITCKYRNWKLGKQTTCNLTPALMAQLTTAGFVFPTDQDIEAYRKQQIEQEQKPKLTWDDFFDMLQKFKDEHGHLSVPRSEPKLGNWTHRQRKEYNKLKRGENSTMNPERLKKLHSIGFTFSNVNWRKDRGLLEADDDDDGSSHENHTDFGMRSGLEILLSQVQNRK